MGRAFFCSRSRAVLTASDDRRLLLAAADAAAGEAHHRARAMVADRWIVQLDSVLPAVELPATGAVPKGRRDALVGKAVANGAMAAARNMSAPLSTATVGEISCHHRVRQIHVAKCKNLAPAAGIGMRRGSGPGINEAPITRDRSDVVVYTCVEVVL
jgi:hypothetical protein